MAKPTNKQFASIVKNAMEGSGFVPMTASEYDALTALVTAYGAKRICDNARAIERDNKLNQQEG